MTPEQLARLGAMMNVINPSGEANELGNCEACAIHVGMVLTDGGTVAGGDTFRDIGDPRWVVKHFRHQTARIAQGEDRAQRVWDWITLHVAPGGVYVFSDGDHTFNIVRDGGALHIIDSNEWRYLTVNGINECGRPIGSKRKWLSYLGPGEDEMEIYFFGQMDERWRAV
jgi:hypothetical protein